VPQGGVDVAGNSNLATSTNRSRQSVPSLPIIINNSDWATRILRLSGSVSHSTESV
jgi:hypothetical protein